MKITKRNLTIFFRDKGSVFFSFLSSIITIGLYFLFLKRVSISEFKNLKHIQEFMDNWIFAGIIGITTITSSISTMGIMVRDKQYKMYKDFYVSPISRSSLSQAYLLSSFLITGILSLFTLIVAELFILLNGGSLLNPLAFLKVFALIALTVFANTSMMFWITSFFKTMNTLSTAATIIGTLIGFLTGIYIPIGSLPEGVQWIIKFFPPAHGVLLFRQVMTEDIMAKCFLGLPAQAIEEIKKAFGIVFEYGGTQAKPWISIVFLLVTGSIFFVFSSFRIKGDRGKN